MKPIVVKNPNAKWMILFFTAVLIYSCWFVVTGQQAPKIPKLRAMPYIGIPGSLFILLHQIGELKTKIFAPEGITVKGLFKTKTYRWNQVIYAATCVRSGIRDGTQVDYDRRKRTAYQKRLLITFQGGSRWRINQWLPFWQIKNLGTGISVPDTTELEEMVRQYYGPLDYETLYESPKQ